MKVIPMIQQLLEALENPSRELSNSLRGGDLRTTGPLGRPQICRFSNYAEAKIEHPQGVVLVSLPLHPLEADKARRTTALRTSVASPLLCDAKYLHEAFTFADPTGLLHTADLVAEYLPTGRPLDEVLMTGCRSKELVKALRALEQEFKARKIAHNNLKPENLWLTPEGKLIAIRAHRLTLETESEADRKAFAALERMIREADSNPDDLSSEPEHVLRACDDFWEVGYMAEGMIRICHRGLYGFMDYNRQWVIEPRFLWAADFREGRAEVRCKSGFGVIDKEGEFVVKPHFQSIEWDPTSCTILACDRTHEILFDYHGEELRVSKREVSRSEAGKMSGPGWKKKTKETHTENLNK